MNCQYQCQCSKFNFKFKYTFHVPLCNYCIYHKLRKTCCNPSHSDCECICIPYSVKCNACRVKSRPYRFHFVCFTCRRGWKQYTPNYFSNGRDIDCCFGCEDTPLDVNPHDCMNDFCESIRCAVCHNPSFVAGYDLRVPPHNAVKKWEELQRLLTKTPRKKQFMNHCRHGLTK